MDNTRDESKSQVTDTKVNGKPQAVEESLSTVDAEVLAKPKRRRFSAKYKLRVLEELDLAEKGQRGAILRREGLYSSSVSEWRRAREAGALGALSKKRGPKPTAPNPLRPKVAKLENEVEQLREELRKANLIIEIQGKVAGLLDLNRDSEKSS